MAGDIQFFDGAQAPDASTSTTIPSQPKAAAGGPISTFDGGDEGHSFGVPERPSNAVSEPSGASGNQISGPLND